MRTILDSGVHCAAGLVLASAVLLCLVRRLSVELSEDSHPESPGWVKRLVASKVGTVAQALLSLMLVVSIGSIAGVIIWEAMKGIAGTLAVSPEVFVAAIVGAVASTIGFGLFALVLSLFGPILSVVYEEWTAYVAPAIGGTAGAAVAGGLAVSVIYMVALGALTGGIALVFHQMTTARERITFKGITELMVAGVGFGAVNGAIVAAVFKILEVTVGIGWLLAG